MEVVSKIARRRSSDAEQSGKRRVRSCSWRPQALQEEILLPFYPALIRGQEKDVTVVAESGQFTKGET